MPYKKSVGFLLKGELKSAHRTNLLKTRQAPTPPVVSSLCVCVEFALCVNVPPFPHCKRVCYWVCVHVLPSCGPHGFFSQMRAFFLCMNGRAWRNVLKLARRQTIYNPYRVWKSSSALITQEISQQPRTLTARGPVTQAYFRLFAFNLPVQLQLFPAWQWGCSRTSEHDIHASVRAQKLYARALSVYTWHLALPVGKWRNCPQKIHLPKK